MGKPERYILVGMVTVLVHVCTCNGSTPQIAQLRSHGDSGTVRISCVARGRPPPRITWKFNGKILVENEQYSFKYNNQSMLIIKKTTEADTGVYRCEADNKLGMIFDEIELKIKGVGEFKDTYREEDECQYRNVTVGLPFSLNCPPHTQAYGQEYKWLVKPMDVWKTGYPFEHIFQAPNGSLVFSYVKRSDVMLIERKGGLTCALVRKFTLIPSVSIKLWDNGNEFKGNIKPTISTFMEDPLEVVEGTPVKLMCGAVGKPLPTLTWLKDGKRIYGNNVLDSSLVNEVVVIGKGMVLKIQKVMLKHEGTYKCLVTNAAGTDQREAKLIVNSHVRWSSSLPSRQHINVFKKAKLECKAVGKPSPTYTWMHNGTAITSSSSRTITGGLLEIPVLDFNHAGMYICIAANSVDNRKQGSFLNVMAFKPSFLSPLEDMAYFFTGTKNSLHCNVTGGPLPSIQWSLNGAPVGNAATQLFASASKSDDGLYSCKASNSEGEVEESTAIKVFDRTVITKGPVDFSFRKGSVANLFCEAEYDASLSDTTTFQWYKNDQILTLTDDGRVHQKKGMKWRTKGIQIVDLQESDGGRYTCKVQTEYKNSMKSFATKDEKKGSITVTGAVGDPTDISVAGDCSGDEISLHWSAPSKYVGPVSHYIIQYEHRDEPGERYTLDTDTKISGTQTSYRMKTEVLPHMPLRFCVRAVAMDGDDEVVSKECRLTDVCNIPAEAPFIAPMGVTAVSDKNGSIVVSWEPIPKQFQSGEKFEVVGDIREVVNDKLKKEDQKKVPGDQRSFKIPLSDVEEGDRGKYEIEVYAQNEKGKGPKTKLTIDHPDNLEDPLQVTNVKVKSVTDKSVTLTWDAVDAVDDYKIYCYESSSGRRRRSDSASRQRVKEVDVTGASEGTVGDLEPSKKYEVTVAAKNVKTLGKESDPVDVKTAPSIPKNVDLNTYGDAIGLTWTPEEDEDDDVTGYDVTWYPSDETDPSKKKKKSVPKDADEAFIQEDLEPLTYYTVELNKVGKDADDKPLDGRPWKMVGVVVGRPDQPGKPDDPTVDGKNETTIDVAYNLPKEKKNSGGLPDQVHVYYQKEGEPDSLLNKTIDYPQQTSTLLTNLDPVPYQIWVVPENKQGRGEPSNKVVGMPSIPPSTTPDTNASAVIADKVVGGGKEFYAELWFIILIALILLILLIALIICAVMNNGNAGRYPVGQKEKKYGGWDNQQLQDYSDNPMDKPNGMPFNAYVTLDQGNQPTHHVIRDKRSASDNSIAKVPILDDCEEDADSLDLYQEDGKFNEDGSFIGEYGDEKQSYTNNGLV